MIHDTDNKNAEYIADMVEGTISSGPSLSIDDGLADYIASLPPSPEPPFDGLPDCEPDYEVELAPSQLDQSEIETTDLATVKECAAEPLNDIGNAKRLLRHFGSVLLHVREIGWHAWNGTHWKREGGDEVAVTCAQRIAPRIALEADYVSAIASEQKDISAGEEAAAVLERMRSNRSEWSIEDKTKARRLECLINAGRATTEEARKRQFARRKFALSSGNTSRIRGMIDLARPHCTKSPDVLDADPYAFNVENGTLKFQTMPDLECPDTTSTRLKWQVEYHKHDPHDLISKVAPVSYDEQAECPRFMAFIKRFQPNDAVRNFLQIYHGYALTGLNGEQCLVFNHGLGANGKSTFIEIVARIMGPYAQTLPFESLSDIGFGRRGDQATPDVARLPGARLVRASEPKHNVHFDEALLKSMTGGEAMLARHLQKGFFEFRPVFKLVLSGNQKPEIGGVDHGIWRRMRLVPWPVTIPDNERRPIEDVLAGFWEERAGILNWLINGTLRFLNEGLQVPQEIIEATSGYREEMDPVGNFVGDCVLAP